ncbi:MAG: transglycosylase domain-containing protein [Ruthenibacterium sp.]
MQRQSGRAPQKKQKKGSLGKRMLMGFLKFIAVCMCFGIIATSVVAVMLSMYIVKATANDDTVINLEDLKLSYTSIIYYKDIDANGKEQWLEYQRLDSPEENRIWVDFGDISKYVKDAYLAIEDKDFYTHSGFNLKRTVFAALNELSMQLTGSYLNKGQQGASTINQQLIKNITDDRADEGTAGYLRKIREIFRALALNNRYSKDVIFEAYLNTLALTGNIGGVQAGANRYFNKNVSDVTIAEAASIAAITKNPTAYSPIQNPENHLKRRNDVIWFMWQQGRITEEEYKIAIDTPLQLAEKKIEENAAKQSKNSYFTDALIKELIQDYKDQKGMTQEEATAYVYTKGLRIYSTVVPSLQTTMEDVFNRAEYWPEYPIENWQPHDNNGKLILLPDGSEPEPRTITTQAAGVSINYTGELCAVVGSLGAKTADRTLNRAIDSNRQVGSAMKPVACYPLAIEYDIASYSSTQTDSPFVGEAKDEKGEVIKNWPKNYSNTYTNGPVTVYEALKQSLNTIAVKYGDFVGVKDMFTFAHDTLEIDTLSEEFDQALAPLVLGSMRNGVSPYKVAGAYQMYGNGGIFYSLHSYTSVETPDGQIDLEPNVNKVQAISSDTAYIMNRLLRNVLERGGTASGMSASEAGMDSVAKTGTTNENKDVWFVGLTPYYVTSMWWGYDESEPMAKYRPRQGTHPGANAWREIMNTEQADTVKYPVKEFPVDETVVKHAFCASSGYFAGPNCPAVTGYYKATTTLPVCSLH